MNTNETIIAQITPKGDSGVGIIRISGDKTLFISQEITKKKLIHKFATKTNIYINDIIIDVCIAILFKKPNSFTGEDTLELNTHGNQKLINYIIKNIIKIFNIRCAKPGEFTLKAFLNKKIDLIEAESIKTMIETQNINVYQTILKYNNLFSKKINNLIDLTKKLIINIETFINFCFDENHIEINNILFNINKLYILLKNLFKNIIINKKLKNEIIITLVGLPNVGKSTFYNNILEKKKSIITNIPGTTRDIIEENINILKHDIKLIDTAGIRKTNNIIEKEGIKMTLNAIKNTDIILYISDNKNIYDILNEELFLKIIKKKKKIIIIQNKIDIYNLKPSITKIKNFEIIALSAKYKWSKDIFLNCLKKYLNIFDNKKTFIISDRIFKCLLKSFQLIKLTKQYLILNINLDIITEIIKIFYIELKLISGQKKDINILNEIFKNFCIGK